MGQLTLNRARFLRLAYTASTELHTRFNIGTYKEKKLHLILKNFFTEDNAAQEVPLAGYIADVLSSDGIIEIQTSGFAAMRGKLEAFLPLYPLTVVYPIAEKKWVSWIDPSTAEITARNRSPKIGKPLDAVPELIFILPYLRHPKLKIQVLLLEMDEYRMLDGKRSRSGKRGSSRYERIPIDLLGGYEFASVDDYIRLLPFETDEVFTSEDIYRAGKFTGRRRSAAIKVLLEVGAIIRVGKQRNAYLYKLGKT